jgi:hypothetical protein
VQVTRERLEIIELSSNMPVNANTVAVRMSDASLQGAEKATAARDGEDHAAQFAQNFLPCFQRDTFGTTEVGKESA